MRTTRRKSGILLPLVYLVVFFALIGLTALIGSNLSRVNDNRGHAAPLATQLYWGAYIAGSTYGSTYGNAPWDLNTWNLFEQHAGKRISILHWGEPWHWTSQAGYPGIGDGYFQKFYAGNFETVRTRGTIPFLDWGSADLRTTPYTVQPNYSLSNISSGAYDAYITQWATDAKAWGHPFFLRLDWEMNGNWYPWSELENGNSAGQYVQMWRHVHDIFTKVGATNVTWVWCPNISSTDTSTSIPLAELYPGDTYVDWVCLDGYNKNSTYLSFEQLFRGKDATTPVTWLNDSYQTLTTIAPTKPIIIGETASDEYPLFSSTPDTTQKANWIRDALTQIPVNYPAIKAVMWFNWNSDSGSTYVIESSSVAQNAFAAGIGSSAYATNTFANLPPGPIQPSTVLIPTTSPSASPTSAPTPMTSASPLTSPPPTSSPIPSPTSSDTIPPQVSFTNPVNGSYVVRGSRDIVTISATDNVGVVNTTLSVNGRVIAQDAKAPYSFSWNVPHKSSTIYVLTAKAYDAHGNVGTASITVTAN
jgi:hypothetical protein